MKTKKPPKQSYIKESTFELEGVIVEAQPSAIFKVKINDTHFVTATLGGKLRVYNIKILVGDRVTVEMSPYDLTRGRLTYRHK
jgi:translation initiation factor IF-1